jgi:hypothetical protein
VAVCRFKKIVKINGSKSYSSFDISNCNYIETSSKSYLDNTHEKLKNLLDKRKTIFTELDELKK